MLIFIVKEYISFSSLWHKRRSQESRKRRRSVVNTRPVSFLLHNLMNSYTNFVHIWWFRPFSGRFFTFVAHPILHDESNFRSLHIVFCVHSILKFVWNGDIKSFMIENLQSYSIITCFISIPITCIRQFSKSTYDDANL